MALVPRYHPLLGRHNKSLLAECLPNSPRDAWTWLADNPRLAAKSGLSSCLSGSPTHFSSVLYITDAQYSIIKDHNQLCILCSWDAHFQSWQPNHHIVLEKNLDYRLHFRLSNIRELNTEQEVSEAQKETENNGLLLLSEDTTRMDDLNSTTNTHSVAIPIPPRGHLKHRSQMIEPHSVLFTLCRISKNTDEHGFY